MRYRRDLAPGDDLPAGLDGPVGWSAVSLTHESPVETRRRLEALDDASLLERCRESDARAWSVLVQRYRRLVYAIPVRAGLDPESCEEVFHATFRRLAQRIDTVREAGRVRAWIVTTARRLVVDEIRRRQTSRARMASEEALENRPDETPLPVETLESLETRHLVHQALERLGDRCRRLLQRLFFGPEDGAPAYEDIARELEMPIGSIGPTRARCLGKLREIYEGLESE
jgi:RNA polymerase sigma factor (sigma-70 family)